MLTIRSKLILAYTTVFGVMLVGFAFLVYRNSQQAEIAKLDAHLQAQAERLQSEIEEQYDEGVFPVPGDLLNIRTEGLTDFHFQMLDSTGVVVLGDSVLPSIPRGLVQQLVHHSARTENIALKGQRYRTLLAPAEVNGRNVYVLQLVSSTVDAEASLANLRLFFLISIPAVLLLASVAAYFITRSAFRPITSMIETAGKISADNLDSRLQLPAVEDEIRLLGETFNTMLERISNSFEQQRRFTADASHELRTPLTVICSELEFAQKLTSDTQSRESIGTALAEIDRLARMTQGMLMLARLDASQNRLTSGPVRLDELLLESIQLLKALFAQKQLELQLHVDEAVEIIGDRDKLKSAILNLLDNAIKYSRNGGKVAVSLSVNRRTSPAISLRIADSGDGIAPAELPNIFKRFYRAPSSRADSSGSGLGLAIVEHVVKMHGGRINVQSKPGKGSAFTIVLPGQVSS
jgi:two-component system, OmpR family, sensor kinase